MEVRVLNFIIGLFNHYGYMVLFVSLLLELIAFPLPGEPLMTYCGYVIYMNKMSWPISIIVATIERYQELLYLILLAKYWGQVFLRNMVIMFIWIKKE